MRAVKCLRQPRGGEDACLGSSSNTWEGNYALWGKWWYN